MQQKKQEVRSIQEDGVDLIALFNALAAKRFLIASLTGFVTVIAILYSLNLTPIYLATSSFTLPSPGSVATLNKLNITAETKDSIFTEFLTHLSSKDLQREVFNDGGFKSNSLAKDLNGISIDSVIINTPKITKKEQSLGFLTEPPYSVSMKGINPEIISEYLNKLVEMANYKTIIELVNLSEINIINRLEKIALERKGLLYKAQKERLSLITRIKEEDGQKIRQINEQIDIARYKAKQSRLNQIVLLNESVKLAKSLDIIENNFKEFSNGKANHDLTITIGKNNDLPDWYLYGEKALIQRIELLKNRTNDDPYIPELITLESQLNDVQNNNLLKTLETRQDDSPFVTGIVELDMEKNKLQKLQSTIFTMSDVNAMKIISFSSPSKNPIKPNKRLIVLVAFITSLLMSILLALIINALKPLKKVHS